MANDINKSIKISLEVVGNAVETLNSAATGLSKVTKSLESFVSGISKIKDISQVIAPLQKLSEVKLPNVKGFVDGFAKLSTMTTVPDLSPFVTELTKLKGLSAPNLNQLAQGLQILAEIKISGISQKITSLSTSLALLKDITLPNFKGIAEGLQILSNINVGASNAKIVSLANALNSLKDITLPNVKNIADGLQTLSGINVGSSNTKITSLSGSLQTLNGITLPNLKNIADGLKLIGETKDISQSNAKLVGLANSLQSLNGITLPNLKNIADGLKSIGAIKDLDTVRNNITKLLPTLQGFSALNIPSFASFTTFLNKIEKINIPSMQKITDDVNKLAVAFENLSKSETVVRALAQIGTAAENLQKKLKNTDDKVKDSTSVWESFGNKLKTFLAYRVIADIFQYLKEAFSGGVDSIKAYDQAMRNLQAITKATSDETDLMGIKLEQVASKSKFSLNEISSGMTILGQAGLNPTQVLDAIEASANLAAGTLSSLSNSVDLVSTTLAVFNMSATKTAHITDVFANAVNGSKLNIEKLQTAFNYVGPIASDAGLKFEELNAALMTLSNAGLRASTMGTSFRAMLNEILEPSVKLTDALYKAGVPFDQLDIKALGLSTVLKNLRTVLTDTETGMVDVGKAAHIFGARAVSGVTALIKQAEDGSFAFDLMMAKTAEYGSAAHMADIQIKGLESSFQNLTSKIQVLFVAFGKSGVTDLLKMMVNSSRALVDILTRLVDNGFIPLVAQVAVFGTAIFFASKGLAFFNAQLIVAKYTAVVSAVRNFAMTMVFFTSSTAAASMGVQVLNQSLRELALTMVASPMFWFVALTTAAVVAYNLFTSSVKKATRSLTDHVNEVSKVQDAYQTSVRTLDDYIERLEKLSENGNSIESQRETKDIIYELIRAYPKYYAEILKAGNSIDSLGDALERIKKIQKTENFNDTQKGIASLSKEVEKAINLADKYRKNLEDAQKSGSFVSPEYIAKANEQLQEAEKNVASSLSRLYLMINEYRKNLPDWDWEGILNLAGAQRTFGKLRELFAEADAPKVPKAKKDSVPTPKEISTGYKLGLKTREEEFADFLYAESKLEAQDVKNKEKYAFKKRKITQSFHRKSVQDAWEAWQAIKGVNKTIEDGRDTDAENHAESEFQRTKTAAREAELSLIKQLGAEAYASYKKLEDGHRRLFEETTKYDLAQLREESKTTQKRENLHEDLIKKEKERERVLTEDLKKLDADLLKVYQKSDESRVKSAERARASLLELQFSMDEKVANILQRNMTNTGIQADNLSRAAKQLKQAEKEMEKARVSGDSISLSKIGKLLDNSEGLFAGLESNKEAIDGLNAIKTAKIALIELTHKLEIQKIEKLRTIEETENAQKKLQATINSNHKQILDQKEFIQQLKNINTNYAEERGLEELRHEFKMAHLTRELNFQNKITTSNRMGQEEMAKRTGTEAPVFTPLPSAESSYDLAEIERLKRKEATPRITDANTRANENLILSETLKEIALKQSTKALEEQATALLNTLNVLRTTPIGESSAQAIADLNLQLEDTRQKIEAVTDPTDWGNLKIGISKAASELGNTQKAFQQLGGTLVNDVNGGILAIVDGTATLKDGFVDMARSMVQSILKVITQLLIMKAIQAAGFGDGGAVGKADGGPIQKLASGGRVQGFSPSEKADNVPIWATAGEFMQPVAAVKKYGSAFMEAVRTLRLPKMKFATGGMIPKLSLNNFLPNMNRYAEGGEIRGASSEGSLSPNFNNQTNLRVINVLDKNMMGDYLSTFEGETTIMNMIRRNGTTIKALLGG